MLDIRVTILERVWCVPTAPLGRRSHPPLVNCDTYEQYRVGLNPELVVIVAKCLKVYTAKIVERKITPM